MNAHIVLPDQQVILETVRTTLERYCLVLPVSGDDPHELFHSQRAEMLKEEIVAAGKKLWLRQYVDGNGGNISARLSSDYVICTPTMLSKGDLRGEEETPNNACEFAPIATFSDLDEAIALANDCEYGLTSSIYTQSLDVAMRAANELKFGETYVNRENFEAMQGFHAGWRKSGIGGADGNHGLEEFLQTHVVYMNYDVNRR